MFPDQSGSLTLGNCLLILLLRCFFLLDNAVDDLIVVYDRLEGTDGGTGGKGKTYSTSRLRVVFE